MIDWITANADTIASWVGYVLIGATALNAALAAVYRLTPTKLDDKLHGALTSWVPRVRRWLDRVGITLPGEKDRSGHG